MTRRRKWAAGIAGGLLLGVVVLVLAFDWNWLKGPIEATLSDTFGRDYTIHGDLEAEFARAPRIVMTDVTVDNADWGSRPHMLEAERFAFVVDLWQLLVEGRQELSDIHLEGPDIRVEQNGDGELNWQSAFAAEEDEPPPRIGTFSAAGGKITYREPEAEREVRVALDQLDGHGGNASEPVTLQATGSWLDRPLALNVEAGSLIEFDAGEAPYPVDVALEVGETAIALAGSITEPAKFRAADLTLDIDAPDPAPLLAALDLPARPAPPTTVQARLVHEREVWAVMDLDARVGESDVSGRAGIDLAKQPMLVKADLRSERLQVETLRALIGDLIYGDEPQAGDKAPHGEQPLVRDGRLNPAILPDVSADLRLEARHVEMEGGTLEDLRIAAQLVDRIPELTATAGGRIEEGPVSLDVQIGSSKAVEGDVEGYPIEAVVEVGQSKAAISGTAQEPLSLAGLDVRFDVASPRPSTLFDLLNVPAFEISGLALSGHVASDDGVHRLSDLAARIGESDVGGTLSLDLSGEEPLIEAELASDRVRLDDVEALLGPKAAIAVDDVRDELGVPVQADQADPVITASGFNPEALPAIDARIAYTLGRFEGREFSLQDVRFRGRLADGLPALELAGDGELEGEAGTFDLRLGSLDDQITDDAAYPVEAHVETEQTTLDLSGSLQQAPAFDAFEAEFDLSSAQPNKWLALADLDAPPVPPIVSSGRLTRNGKQWQFADLYLEAGESNLSGNGSVDLAGERPKIVADLQSDRLVTEEFLAADDQEEAADGDEPVVVGRAVNFAALPAVDADVSLRAAYLSLRNEVRFEPIVLDLQLRDRVAVVDLSAEGTYREGPVTIEAQLGTEESLREPDARYPVEVALVTPQTEVRVEGSVGEPLDFTDLDVEASFQGEDLEELGDIIQFDLPSTPPYRLSGEVRHRNEQWSLANLEGRIGESDVAGDIALDMSRARPMVIADLRSDRLDFADVGGFLGAPPDPEAPLDENVLPEDEVPVPDLQGMDLQLEYTAGNVVAGRVPVEEVEVEARLENGVLRIAPASFDLGVGAFTGEVSLDTREDPHELEVDLRLHNAEAEYLFDLLEIELPDAEPPLAVGRVNARVNGTARGSSVAEIAETAEGQLAAIVEGGMVTAVLVEGLEMNLLEVLGLTEVDPEEMTPVRCFVGSFEISEGVMRIEALVLDTEQSLITGAGAIDLGAERVEIALQSNPREAEFPVLAPAPVEITGSFDDVEVAPEEGAVAETFLNALGLGVVLPVVGAAIPFVEPGFGEDSDCAELISAAEAEADSPD